MASPPLIARLLLDAQNDFLNVADPIPADPPRERLPGLNHPAWVIAHTANGYDGAVNAYAQGKTRDSFDPWHLEWSARQSDAGREPVETSLEDARAALHRVFRLGGDFVRTVTEDDLTLMRVRDSGGRQEEVTVAYLLAHAVAHLYTHASELNVIGVSMGLAEHGFPGKLRNTRGT